MVVSLIESFSICDGARLLCRVPTLGTGAFTFVMSKICTVAAKKKQQYEIFDFLKISQKNEKQVDFF